MAFTGKLRSGVLHDIPAGIVKPNPKLGAFLGKLHINLAQFCKAANDKTANLHPGIPVRVYFDQWTTRKLEIWVETPKTAWFFERTRGYITPEEIYKIGLAKRTDLHYLHLSLEQICTRIANEARRSRIKIVRKLSKEEQDRRDALKPSEMAALAAQHRLKNARAAKGSKRR